MEFETGPQNPDFRHALAQLIDYRSDLWGNSVADFDDAVVQRYLMSARCPAEYKGVGGLHELVQRSWDLDEPGYDRFTERLGFVLQEGDFHFVVAAQRFTPTMTRSLDYLNKAVRVGMFHLVQIMQLTGADVTAYSAQVISAPSASRRGSRGATEDAFLADIDDGAYREALKDIFDTCRALGLSFEWGAREPRFAFLPPTAPSLSQAAGPSPMGTTGTDCAT